MNESITPIEKRNKKNGRFNLIDFLLIVMILLIVSSLIYIFLPTSLINNVFSDKEVDFIYTIEIKGIDAEFLENIKENDVVLDSVSKSNIGTVTAVDYSTQYTELEYNETTQSGVLAVFPDKYTMLVTISANAKYNEGEGYTINGTRIAVGEKINARFPNYLCEGYCISISTN